MHGVNICFKIGYRSCTCACVKTIICKGDVLITEYQDLFVDVTS